jgi:hypothetical protein
MVYQKFSTIAIKISNESTKIHLFYLWQNKKNEFWYECNEDWIIDEITKTIEPIVDYEIEKLKKEYNIADKCGYAKEKKRIQSELKNIKTQKVHILNNGPIRQIVGKIKSKIV